MYRRRAAEEEVFASSYGYWIDIRQALISKQSGGIENAR
jgi:hypothetical protein